jgi:uncharacterized protein (UPF0297 family)
MDNLFLPREVGGIETGPQIFAKTDVLDTTFYFSKENEITVELPGLLNSVLVQNAGYNNLNGIFDFVSLFEGEPYYNKNGDGSLFIIRFNNQWQIYDFNENSIDPIYFSDQDVLYPWNATEWNSLSPIYNPVPTVTKVL